MEKQQNSIVVKGKEYIVHIGDTFNQLQYKICIWKIIEVLIKYFAIVYALVGIKRIMFYYII